MGVKFGELYKIRGIIYFKLSPHEQKAFTGAITHSVGNVMRRIRSNLLTVVPPFATSYVIYQWAMADFHKSQRKNPKDFENDV